MDSDLTVRPLREDDLPQAWRLGALAFGADPDATPPPHARAGVAWMSRVGAFDRRGVLVGCARVLHDGQWWQGRPVPAADVAGVAVAPEARGRGVARRMLGALLAEARERGAAVSTLFPTVAAPYRRAGWEICGTLR
ncbi:MAG TPA: GNAT family N-acetyltransferase, partial [Pilimelia sp.]|nr:GNAT family N-acetyltransferase [Pilimelia sp.]